MEENKDEELAKYHKEKRRKRKRILALLTTFFMIISIIAIIKYYVLNIKNSIKFSETSNIDYGVNLLDNQFYKTDHLGENIDVISSLIKDMDIEFKYNLSLEEEIEYVYSYEIIANIELKEKNKTNLIYNDEQVILKKEEQEDFSKKLEIVEQMNLKYSYCDNQIKQLIEQYKLDNTVSELNLSMKLKVLNKATGERINKETKVMTISMPLNSKTVEISVNEAVRETPGEIILKEDNVENPKKYLIISVVTLVIGLINLIILLRYNSKTRSAEKMYEKELNKILFDYKSYIQKISTPIDYSAYKIIKIETFAELLQMREEVQSPILMYTEKNQLKTIFIIIKDNMLFVYMLSSKAIRKKLIEEYQKRKEIKEDEKNK